MFLNKSPGCVCVKRIAKRLQNILILIIGLKKHILLSIHWQNNIFFKNIRQIHTHVLSFSTVLSLLPPLSCALIEKQCVSWPPDKSMCPVNMQSKFTDLPRTFYKFEHIMIYFNILFELEQNQKQKVNTI